MRITKIREKTVLLSDDGYILHAENSLEAMRAWTAENFSESLKNGKIVEDFSGAYKDERGFYVTRRQLFDEYEAMSEAEKDGRSRTDYILDCMSINGGTLTV